MNKNINGKTNKEKLPGRYVLLTVLFVLLLLAGIMAMFLSLYKPGTGDDPAFVTDGTTADGGKSTEAMGDTEEGYTRKTGFYTFLLAGRDVISGSTDVLMLASLDTVNNRLSIVQIPRDTYVNKTVGGYKTVNRVNAVYAAAYNRAVGSGTKGKAARIYAMEDLEARLEKSLCVSIDEYVLTDTEAFRNIIDAVGGIEYDVPFDMDYEDPEQNLYIHLKAGKQLLSGKDAEGLIRYRAGYKTGDIGRIELRASFLKEMLAQVKSKMAIDSFVKVIGEVITKVDTSVSLADAVYFAGALYKIPAENVTVKTISGQTLCDTESGLWLYYCINKNGTVGDVNEYLNVFKKDITADMLDPDGFFTDTVNASHEYINNYYNS